MDDEEPKGTLTTQVYVQLRRDVLSGDLPPGRKLRIEELARRYGSGSSPVREALHLLASEGLIERLEQRGFRVRPVSEAEFLDILEMRCWADERALRDAIANGDSAWEDGIVLAFFRLEQIAPQRRRDPKVLEWETCHKRFHSALIAAAPSPMLRRYCNQLYDLTIRYRIVARPRSGPRRDVQAEHKAIMDAAIARDADTACRELVSHYQLTGDYLRKSFEPSAAAAQTKAGGRQASVATAS